MSADLRGPHSVGEPVDPRTYQDRRCPLPVFARNWLPDDRQETNIVVCDSPLTVRGVSYSNIYEAHREGDEPSDVGGEYADWRVECHAGHVLLMPRNENGDDHPEPFEWPKAEEALNRLRQSLGNGTLAEGPETIRALIGLCTAVVTGDKGAFGEYIAPFDGTDITELLCAATGMLIVEVELDAERKGKTVQEILQSFALAAAREEE